MQDHGINNMATVINSLYMSAVQQVYVHFKILMWTLLACTFTYVCTFAPYSNILTGVNFVHVNGAHSHAHIYLRK